MTVDARLIEQANGKWRVVCMGRFRGLGVSDTATYDAFVTFFEEGAQSAQLKDQVTGAITTRSKSALGNTLTITHPSADPTGSLTVRMVHGTVDPRRRHSCQVVIKQNGTEVMRVGSRMLEHQSKPSGVLSDSGQTFAASHQTRSVALGDLDGDGDLDAFRGVAQSGPNRVLLNNGSGVFADSGQALGNHYTMAVALGDLDGDGDLDAFEGNYNQASRIWLNDSLARFTDSGQTLDAHRTRGITLGDLDGDGDLDAFQTNGFDDNRVWLNNGAGVFADSGQVLANQFTSFPAALGDVDGDGDLDSLEGPAILRLNDGSGVFTDTGQVMDGYYLDAALGDADGDGDLDVLVSRNGNKVWLNNGAGEFADNFMWFGNQEGYTAEMGDLDGDGDLDWLMGSRDLPNRIFLNDGSGSFSDSGQALGSHRTMALALGDLDNDGDLDAFEVNGNFQASRVWLNQ